MKILKFLFISTILVLLFSSFNGNSHKTNKSVLNQTKTEKDFLWVFKSDSLTTTKVNSDGTLTSNSSISQISYHIINFSTSEIITNVYSSKKKEWIKQTFKYYSTNETPELKKFNVNNGICDIVYLDVKNFQSIVYSFLDNNIFEFSNLEIIDNNKLNELGIYYWIDSFEVVETTKEIIINETIKDFEYSEYWRKESFKKTIDFMNKIISKDNPNCKIVSRGYYNPNLVKYIGNQGFQVKYYCEFDCKQNHINQSYFYVDAYYLGYGKWDLELIEQKLTH
ncbi:hypothetical protein NHF50_10535 [Flavobacterium sp. NRK F10]|uniref:hypothetical protein n=1 Tax=Flavobacterium sp. NRK F10 TaxID=2954931 RepID=UPI002090A8B8|nr:hypothetical protein [Flavobacterium sp. NRK F10]MCO6175480.1 hypothetical protein [Flavobacterium sp. NRK F10]